MGRWLFINGGVETLLPYVYVEPPAGAVSPITAPGSCREPMGTVAPLRQAVWSEGLGRGRLGLVVRWIVLSDGAAAPGH